MLTHDQIWLALDRLAKTFGYSPSGLAKQAGLDPTSFNKSKRLSPDGKPRWPSTESVAKVLAVTGATMSEFISLIDHEGDERMTMKSMDRKAIAQMTAEILIQTKSILFNANEPFTLKSGRKSPVYFDGRRLISFVNERATLMDAGAQVLASEVGMENIDYLAGGETAGIPYAAFIAERLQKPMLYVRKEPKGYGRMAQIEGVLPEKGSPKVILIEDMQTDGGSKKIFINALRDAGASVKHAFVMFHYGIFPQSEQNMKDAGIKLHALATWWDVLAVAKERKYFDAPTLQAVERFLNAPNEWEA